MNRELLQKLTLVWYITLSILLTSVLILNSIFCTHDNPLIYFTLTFTLIFLFIGLWYYVRRIWPFDSASRLYLIYGIYNILLLVYIMFLNMFIFPTLWIQVVNYLLLILSFILISIYIICIPYNVPYNNIQV